MADRVHLENDWLSYEGRKASEKFTERLKRELNIFVSALPDRPRHSIQITDINQPLIRDNELG